MTKQPTGRKPKSETGKRALTFSTRLAPELREAMEEEAKAEGVPLSEILDRRLRASFGTRQVPDHIKAMMTLIEETAFHVQYTTGESWIDDRYTYEATRSAVDVVMNAVAPTGEIQLPKRVSELVESTSLFSDELWGTLPPEKTAALKEADEANRALLRRPGSWGNALADDVLKLVAHGGMKALDGNVHLKDICERITAGKGRR